MQQKETIITFLVAVLFGILFLSATPHKAIKSEYLVIEEGATLSYVIKILHERNYIYSPLLTRIAFSTLSGGESVKAGTYYIKPRASLPGLVRQLTRAEYGVESIKVTIPEGANVFEVATILESKLPSVSAVEFLTFAENSEGYLFPDTYLFSPNDSPETVYEKFITTFEEKTKDLFTSSEIYEDAERVYEILKLASIIEEEAKNPDDRRLISGVLYNRLEIDMALQVDVTFQYINGKNSYELTLSDLKDPSLYNTYVHRGLPPTPISNPGLDSIDAALNPAESDYLYFLAGRDGTTYFSETFEEHVRNRKHL